MDTFPSLSFTDGAALLQLLLSVDKTGIATFPDLTRLSHKMHEIERKYYLVTEPHQPEKEMARFLGVLGNFICTHDFPVEKFVPFVGIDQYFLLHKDETDLNRRYRVGVNRLPHLTVKFLTNQESITVRGEINLDVSSTSPDIVRTFVAVIAQLADSYELFSVPQSGNFCVLRDPNHGEVEIVVYKVDRIAPTRKKIMVPFSCPSKTENI